MRQLIDNYHAALGERARTIRLVNLMSKRAGGKGTMGIILCALLAPYGQYHAISVSDTIDAHIAKFDANSEHLLGRQLKEQTGTRKKGGLMNSQPVTQAVINEIVEAGEILDNGPLTLFLDGFPRMPDQGDVVFELCPTALGFYLNITDDEVYARTARRTQDRKEQGLPPRDDDHPLAVKTHLENWPKTAETIRRIQMGHLGSILPIDGMGTSIRDQIRLCLVHLGFSPTEIANIMWPLSTNPEHEASKIVRRIEGPTHDRKILKMETSVRHQPPAVRWFGFSNAHEALQTRARA